MNRLGINFAPEYLKSKYMDAQSIVQDAIRNGGSSQLLFVSASDLREAIRNMANDIAEQFQPRKKEEYLNTKQTAKILGVDPSTLYRWKRDKYLVPSYLGNKCRYRMSDIEAILNAR